MHTLIHTHTNTHTDMTLIVTKKQDSIVRTTGV